MMLQPAQTTVEKWLVADSVNPSWTQGIVVSALYKPSPAPPLHGSESLWCAGRKQAHLPRL